MFASESTCFIDPVSDAHLLHGSQTIPHTATCYEPLYSRGLVRALYRLRELAIFD